RAGRGSRTVRLQCDFDWEACRIAGGVPGDNGDVTRARLYASCRQPVRVYKGRRRGQMPDPRFGRCLTSFPPLLCHSERSEESRISPRPILMSERGSLLITYERGYPYNKDRRK